MPKIPPNDISTANTSIDNRWRMPGMPGKKLVDIVDLDHKIKALKVTPQTIDERYAAGFLMPELRDDEPLDKVMKRREELFASFRRDVEVTTNRGPVYGIDNKNLYLYEIFRYYILLLEDHRVWATLPKSVVLNKLGLEETARIFLLRALSFVQEYQDEPSTVPSWSLKWPDTIKVLTEYTKLALLPAVKQVVAMNNCIPDKWTSKR